MSDLPPAQTSGRLGARLLMRIDKLLSSIERVTLTVSCALTVFVMLIVSADAISRYLFNAPIGFTFDLVIMYVMPATLFFALSFTLRHGAHVNVDLIIGYMRPRRFDLLSGLLMLVALPLVLFLATEGVANTWRAWLAGDVTTGVYAWQMWLSEIIVPIGFGLLAARVAHMAVANLYAGITGERSVAILLSPHRISTHEEAI